MDPSTLKFLQRRTKDILSKSSADRRVAAVDGYLLALETVAAVPNHVPSFTFERIDGTADRALDAVTQHLGPGLKVELVPADNWQWQLSKDLLRFLYPVPDEKVRRDLVERLVVLLNRACSDTASAWKVIIEPDRKTFFHCAWETYLFPTPHGLFLLHCSVDD
jgi:hypothetical protein